MVVAVTDSTNVQVLHQATFAQSSSFGWSAWRRSSNPWSEPVAERVRVCEIDDDKGKRLVRIMRRGTGSLFPHIEVSRAAERRSAERLAAH